MTGRRLPCAPVSIDDQLYSNDVCIDTHPHALHCSAKGKRLFFVTNNSSKSRAQYLDKFAKLRIQARCGRDGWMVYVFVGVHMNWQCR